MANLNSSNNRLKTEKQSISDRSLLERRYNSAHSNLLLVVIFTLINCGLLIANSNTYFLFTASVPYIIVDLGMYLCGKYPAEFYESVIEGGLFGNGVYLFFISVAAIIILLYLVCWLFARKGKVGWLIAALVLFGIDTIAMFNWYVIGIDMIMDYVFHAWVLISLIMGIAAYYKLKKLPEPTPEPEAPVSAAVDGNTLQEQTDKENYQSFFEFDDRMGKDENNGEDTGKKE